MTKQVKVIAALLIVVVAACCAALLLPKHGGSVVRISQDGTVLREVALDQMTQPELIPVPAGEGHSNLIRVEPGRVCVVEANCPDQVCVNQGWISDSSVPIVCLPNKVIVEILGEEGQFDAAAK